MSRPCCVDHRHTVLVVDDDEHIRIALSDLLRREGAEPMTAADVPSALALVAERVPCLALVDVMMPGTNGLELCRRLKADPRTAEVAVVLITGMISAADVEAGMAAGASDYVKKPFDRDEVRFRIRTHLQLHQAMRERELIFQRLSVISAAAHDAIILMDGQGRIAHWNEAAEAMFGYGREAALGQPLHTLLAPARYANHHDEAFPAFRACGGGDAVGRTVELTALRQSGEEFPIELSLASSRVDGEWWAVGIVRDITERNAAMERRQLLEATVEHSDATILITNPEGIIEYVNPAFVKRTGYTSEEALGRTPAILKSGYQDEAHYRVLWETIRAGRTWQGHFINRRKDGSLYEEAATISPRVLPDGSVTHFIAINRDVTELYELQRQLAQAQKLEAIGQLAAGIAHEINTPTQFIGDNLHFLTTAFTRLDAVAADYLAQEHEDWVVPRKRLEYLRAEVPRALEQAAGGVARVAGIVKAMKEFSHPGAPDKTPADLNRALANTVTVAHHEWKYVAEVTTELDPSLPLVPCLVAEINQVVLNLIVNAAHAIASKLGESPEAKGTITVATRHAPPWAELRISDTGCGIQPEHRARVFDPFFTTKPVGQGSGQGLSIARGVVVEKHGGQIELETTVGVGTTFVVRLPLEETCVALEEVAS